MPIRPLTSALDIAEHVRVKRNAAAHDAGETFAVADADQLLMASAGTIEAMLIGAAAGPPFALARLGRMGDSRVMGVSAWSFVRPRPGELHPLAQRTVEAFLSKRGRIPADPEGFVRYAQVMVRFHDRHAVEVLRVGFFQHRALPDGSLDRKHFDGIMAVVPEAALGALRVSKAPLGVIEAQDKFAKRRLEHLSQWKPTKADEATLREQVNRKAGRKLM